MVDVNTIIGEPIQTSSGTVIIPISKVCFGFAAGGSEFKGETIGEYKKNDKDEEVQYSLPFGGGSGAGVSINPVAFLVVQQNNVKLLPVSHTSMIDKLLDYVPDLMEKTNTIINKGMQNKNGEKQERKTKEEKTETNTAKARVKRTKRPNTVVEYEYDEEYDPDMKIENFTDEENEE